MKQILPPTSFLDRPPFSARRQLFVLNPTLSGSITAGLLTAVFLGIGALARADSPPPAAAAAKVYDVREFGAKGDGKTLDTAAIQKALELDDAVAEAHASRGLLLNDDWEYVRAEGEFRRALELNPSYASAHHWYAICLACMGNLEEAIEQANLASQSDPLSPPARNILGVMYLYARQFDKALEVFNSVLKLDPDFSPTLNFRANLFACLGKEEEAMRDLEQGRGSATQFDMDSSKAFYLAWFGHTDEARRHFEAALRGAPSPRWLPYLHAAFCACLNDRDGFFEWAPRAVDAKLLDQQDLRYAPWLDRMREDPRYTALLKGLSA